MGPTEAERLPIFRQALASQVVGVFFLGLWERGLCGFGLFGVGGFLGLGGFLGVGFCFWMVWRGGAFGFCGGFIFLVVGGCWVGLFMGVL